MAPVLFFHGHGHGQFFLINYKNNLLQICEFKFEDLNFKFCLANYVKSYKQIMFM